ncbi:MAG: ribulose-phosphate 3-epimerase [Pirellulales bacterium]|nr:ribulose-phosphate 3-epimerase [Pirellulales bacterium]
MKCLSRRARFRQLGNSVPLVMPSLLACDFGNLEREVERLEAAGAEALHLDVMDGHFVPNLTFGMPIAAALRRLTDLPIDAHLMVTNPVELVEPFVDAGVDSITIHVEPVDDPAPILTKIRKLGVASGISLNPPTPVDVIQPYLDLSDMVLVMSVMPGFGGQVFEPVALAKLRSLREQARQADREDILLQVDGGVNDETIGNCTAAGADILVVGSAFFSHKDYGRRLEKLSQLALQSLA